MKDKSISNFGLLIAYVLPGLLVLWGLSEIWPGFRTWFATTAPDTATIGGFLYITVAAIGAGLTASTARWILIDSLHHRTGIPPPNFNFARLSQGVEAFYLLIEIHYRYYQFYANSFVAGTFGYAAWRMASVRPALAVAWSDLAYVAMAVLFFAASRDTLRRYYDRVAEMLSERASLPLIFTV